MELHPSEIDTLNYYNNQAKEWNLTRGGTNRSPVLSNSAKHFKELLTTGKILEIGSGVGEDAATLVDLGYEYIGIDISEEFVKLAKQNNPKLTFLNMPVYKLEFPDATFDGFWSSATILHIPKDKIKIALDEINRVIKKDGIGFITIKEGEGEKTDPATGRFFSYYTKEDFSKILEKSNFVIVEMSSNIDPKNNHWINIYVRKS